MCTRYISPEAADIERLWHVGSRNPLRWAHDMFPRYQGPFIRAEAGERRLGVGQWALVPWFAKTAKLPYLTCNARSEELAAKASYRDPWKRGQRCIIPAESFFEPCWETGKHVPWRFRRPDGQAWGLAGLWNTWTDRETGEVVESYTMLTINADGHPLMGRMHKPDLKRPPNRQDKRSVVPIALADVDAWLTGPVVDAAALVRLVPAAAFDGSPDPGGAVQHDSL